MSDPVPAVPVDPVPEPPIKVNPPVADTDAITALLQPDSDGYTTHVLTEPAYGWVNNGTSWILLAGQQIFTLAGTGDLSYGDPPPPPPDPGP